MIEEVITERLANAFMPTHLKVINESHLHRSEKGAESHFKVIIVSLAFEHQPRVKRHQLIYQQLADLLAKSVHALALHLYTPEEWAENEGKYNQTPSCAGHNKSE